MKQVRYLTKSLLAILLESQAKWGFNRQVDPKVVQEIVDRQPDHTKYPISSIMIHEHRNGVLTEPHHRCFLVLSESALNHYVVDMSTEFYDSLPVQELPD